MKKGEKTAVSEESKLLKELKALREQTRKAAHLEAENRDLKKALDKKEKQLKDTEEKWENGEREIEKLKYLLFEANYQISQWKKRFFGSTQERFVPTYADQLVLDLNCFHLLKLPL